MSSGTYKGCGRKNENGKCGRLNKMNENNSHSFPGCVNQFSEKHVTKNLYTSLTHKNKSFDSARFYSRLEPLTRTNRATVIHLSAKTSEEKPLPLQPKLRLIFKERIKVTSPAAKDCRPSTCSSARWVMSPGVTSGNSPLFQRVVKENFHHGDKHGRYPQVHFVGQTIRCSTSYTSHPFFSNSKFSAPVIQPPQFPDSVTSRRGISIKYLSNWDACLLFEQLLKVITIMP